MPYIKDEDKKIKLRDAVQSVSGLLSDPGSLACLVATAMDEYMKTRKFGWNDLGDCYKAVDLTTQDFRRRFIDAREDQVIVENGDVYTFHNKEDI